MTSGSLISALSSARRASICSTSCWITHSSVGGGRDRETRPAGARTGADGNLGAIARRLACALLVALGLAAGPAGCSTRRAEDVHGAAVLRYALASRLVHRTLDQVAVRPARAGAHPPLLVFLHGRGQSPDAIADGAFFAALARLGPGAPAVVLPAGGFSSYWHDRRGGRWADYVLREVIPAAQRRLGTDARRVAVGGISMGGFGAYALARAHPGRFCAVGGHSAAIFTGAGVTAPGAFDDAADFARHDLLGVARARGRAAFGAGPLWLDDGDADPFHPADAQLAAALHVVLHTWPGRHETGYWDAHYGDYLRFYARALARCRR
jgi:S-formylglutathione hydrolase FrmB